MPFDVVLQIGRDAGEVSPTDVIRHDVDGVAEERAGLVLALL